MIIDKQEKKLLNRRKFKKVDKIIQEELKNSETGLGSCHSIWDRRKQLLKDMYNIDWKTPAELNPDIIFD
ncbi:MAG: hypothetical protein IJA61_01975 [Clostridia bacterium]|nr:hypothetical protein [Clostridia bacterium]